MIAGVFLTACLAAGATLPLEPMTFNLARLSRSLDAMRAAGGFLSIGQRSPRIEPSDAPLPKGAALRFEQLQRAAFGAEAPFILRSCRACDAGSDLVGMIVYVDPAFLEAAGRACGRPGAVSDFILAHELSHYAFEWAVKEAGRSPHGQDTMLTDPGWDPRGRVREELEKSLRRARRHAEVDAFAAALLARVGADAGCGLALIKTWRKIELPDARIDAEVRYQSLERALHPGSGAALSSLPARLEPLLSVLRKEEAAPVVGGGLLP